MFNKFVFSAFCSFPELLFVKGHGGECLSREDPFPCQTFPRLHKDNTRQAEGTISDNSKQVAAQCH